MRFGANILRGVESVDLSVTVMGQKLAMPIYCSPTALQRLFHHQGEWAVAAAEVKYGTPQTEYRSPGHAPRSNGEGNFEVLAGAPPIALHNPTQLGMFDGPHEKLIPCKRNVAN